MGFLGRIKSGIVRFLGKVKGGMGRGLQLYDKVKGYYDGVKNKFANLPIIGTAASELISRGETYLSDLIQKKTGFDPRMIARGAKMAREVYDYLPSKPKPKEVINLPPSVDV